MEINMPFDSSERTMDLVKLSALYYDKVNLFCPVCDNEKLYNEHLLNSMNMLEKSNVVSFSFINIGNIISTSPPAQDNEQSSKKHGMYSLIDYINIRDSYMDQYDFLYQSKSDLIQSNDDELITDLSKLKANLQQARTLKLVKLYIERIALLEQNIEQVNNIARIISETKEYQFKTHMYSQLIILFMLVRENKDIMANDLLKASLNLLYKNKCSNYRCKYGNSSEMLSEAVPIFLPDYYKMDIEDILDLRYLAKDELEEMRSYINSLSLEYSPDDKKLENLKLYLNSKITPAIRQLENKVYNLRIGTTQKALQSLKNPFTYTPLLTSLFTNISAHISLAASVGLIAAETVLEYLKEKKEIEANPLYFSIQLKKAANKLL